MTKAGAFRGFRFPTEVILWEERIQRESYVDHPWPGMTERRRCSLTVPT